MRGDQHILSGAQLGCDALIPARLHALERDCQRLGCREIFDARVARVVRRVPLVRGFQLRRRNIVAAAPDVDLLVAVLGGGLGLVEALQGAVVAFVQAPVADHRYPHPVHFVEHQPQRANGAFEYRRERDVELIAHLAEQLAGVNRLPDSLFGEVDVFPAREQVLEVPVTLAVTTEYELARHVISVNKVC